MANLDTDGDGDSDAADYPAALKLTDGERTALVPLYAPGDELFRVPIPHLSPWDHNWPYAFPPGAGRPRIGPDGRLILAAARRRGSSTIDCENQRLDRGRRRSPARPTASPTRRTGSRAAPSRSFDVAVTPSDAARRPPRRRAQGRRSRARRSSGATPIPPIFPGVRAPADHAGHRRAHRAGTASTASGSPVVGSVKAHLTLNYYYRAVPVRVSATVSTPPGPRSRAGASADAPFGGRQGCSDVSAFGADGDSDLCAFKLSATGDRGPSASTGRGQTSGSEGGTSTHITSTTRWPARSASATARSAVPARSMSAA